MRILFRYGISVPSPEDDEREENDKLGLYGSTYYDLLDCVEELLVELLEKMPAEIISYKFSGNV